MRTIIRLLLLPFLLLASLAHATNQVSPIMHFAAMFPTLTEINHQFSTSIASNGQSSFTPAGMIYPENEMDLLQIVTFFNELKKHDSTLRPLVIGAGSRRVDDKMTTGWSFDSHAHGQNGDIVLSTHKLSGFYRDIDWRNKFDRRTGVVKVWAFAGTPWRKLVDMVNDSYAKNIHDDEHYFVPMISPTGSNVTIGGSFASNTHSRATSVMGGYFADTVDAFNMVTIVDGSANLVTVNKNDNPDLFYAVIGSFGRGGIVSAMEINLQLVAKKQVATTKLKKVSSMEEMTNSFAVDRARMIADTHGLRNERAAFLASVGLISADFDTFFMLENDIAIPTTEESGFPLYGPADCKAMFIQKAAHACPKLADFVANKFLTAQCAKSPCEFFSGNCTGVGEFHDQPLNNYVFFQDSFARTVVESKAKDHQTAHFTLMHRLENLPRVTEEIRKIKMRPEFEDITFELQDLLPLPSTRVLMAPGYSAEPNDEIFVAYTISWPVDEDSREISHRLERAFESELYNIKVDGKPLAWLHPLKEFSFKNGPIKFYADAAQKLEAILQEYHIDDRGIFHSKIHDYLYSR